MAGEPATEVTACPGGPLLVRGPVTVVADDGSLVTSRRPVSALCRCGASRRSPWCDGTHKLAQTAQSTGGEPAPTEP